MKKGLSILLVLTMLFAMVPAVAVHGTAGDTLPGQVTVTGTGGITTIGSAGDILGGSLPTSANLHFTIDPLNLLGVERGQIIDLDARNTAVNFGDESVLEAWSTSSVETLLTVTLSLEDGGATAVLNEAAVTAGNTTAVLMWMEPSASYRNVAEAPFIGLGQVVPYGTSAVPVQFRLQARPHDTVATGVITDGVVEVELQPAADAAALYGTAFSFGGIINADADGWGEIGNMSVSAVFDIVAVEGIASASAFRTDGDVTADARMLASHGLYVAPTLIPLPEGGAVGGILIANDLGWVTIGGITGAAAVLVNGANIPAAHVVIAGTDVHVLIPLGTHTITVHGPAPTWSILRTVNARR